MRVRSVWLAGIMAAGALLGGCADEKAPSTLPEVTASETLLVTEGQTATPLAERTAQETEEGIRAFYSEYARLTDESLQSREALDQSRMYFADTCVSCLAGYEIAAQALARGHTIQGEPTRIVTVDVDSVEGDLVVFRTVLDVPAATERDAEGNVVAEYPATPNVSTVYTARRQPSGDWLIVADQVLG